jgi:hypothetical protein
MAPKTPPTQRQTRKMSRAASIPNIASNTKYKKNTPSTRKRTLDETNVSDSEKTNQSHRSNPAEASAPMPDGMATTTDHTQDVFFSRLVAGSRVHTQDNSTIAHMPDQAIANIPNNPTDTPETVEDDANMETTRVTENPVHIADSPKVS